jgi:tRNA pseudouridine13 synthase
VLAAGKRLLRFHVSALQSALFNDALALRVDALDGIERGDIAWIHRTERVFEVEDPTAAAESARRCEISASGPLFGPRMLEPSGTPARRERSVLDGAGLTAHDFSATGPWGAPGGRRPLRVPGISFRAEGGRGDAGPFLRLEFALPPGAYATAVLREIAKGRLEVGTARAWEAAR